MSTTMIQPPPIPVDEAPAPLALPPEKRRPWPLRLIRGIAAALDWIFGLLAIVGGLAALSIVPVLNFLSLGYLLECSGRVARTGRIRDGFVGIRKASIIGSIVLCIWLATIPIRVISGLWKDARLIDPTSPAALFMAVLLGIFTIVTLAHIGWACARGGRLQHFLWPSPIYFFRWLRSQRKLTRMRLAMLGYVQSLRLPHYFWLGARGFVGGVIWLILPVSILIAASQLEPGPGALLSFVGGLGLMVVIVYLPFLQAQFADTGKFRDLFGVKQVRDRFVRAPVAFWLALLTTLLFAMPLYLLKIELTPQEVAWLPALFFVAFIFPARILVGWAMGRGRKRETPRFFLWPWMARFLAVPVAFAYVFWVYLMQYFSWSGTQSLLEQHAFLVPAPLLGL